MGYSCGARAMERLNYIFSENNSEFGSNTWKNRDTTYFYEIGRENRDGSVTGSVYQMIDDSHAKKAGSFKIDSSGTVERFLGLSSRMKELSKMSIPMFYIV